MTMQFRTTLTECHGERRSEDETCTGTIEGHPEDATNGAGESGGSGRLRDSWGGDGRGSSREIHIAGRTRCKNGGAGAEERSASRWIFLWRLAHVPPDELLKVLLGHASPRLPFLGRA